MNKKIDRAQQKADQIELSNEVEKIDDGAKNVLSSANKIKNIAKKGLVKDETFRKDMDKFLERVGGDIGRAKDAIDEARKNLDQN